VFRPNQCRLSSSVATPSCNQVCREIFGVNFASLFAPEPDERGFVLAHDYSGIGAADKSGSPLGDSCDSATFHDLLQTSLSMNHIDLSVSYMTE